MMILYYVHTSDIVFDKFYALSVTGKVDKYSQSWNSLIFEDHVTALDVLLHIVQCIEQLCSFFCFLYI